MTDDDFDPLLILIDELTASNPTTMATIVQSSQLNTIKIFDNQTEKDIESWCDTIDTAKISFEWDEKVAAAAARSKLQGTAHTWVRAEKMMGRLRDTWKDLRKGLIEAFGQEMNNVTAAKAVQSLRHQGNSETIQEFHDRIVIAMDRKNFAMDEVAKATATYKEQLQRDIFVFLTAGMKEEVHSRVYSGKDQPTTTAELLKAAKAIEKDLLKDLKTRDVAEIQLEHGQSGQGQVNENTGPNGESVAETLTRLTNEIAALKLGRGQNPAPGLCWNCGKTGHMARNCRSPYNRDSPHRPRNSFQNRNRGGNNYRGGQRRSDRRSNSRRRPQQSSQYRAPPPRYRMAEVAEEGGYQAENYNGEE